MRVSAEPMTTAGAVSPMTESRHRSYSSSATSTEAEYCSAPTFTVSEPPAVATWQFVITLPVPITTPLPSPTARPETS